MPFYPWPATLFPNNGLKQCQLDAEHDGHLPPIFASPCEFLDNSLRALRGQTMECPKKILAKFNLESQAQAASSSHAQPGTYKDQVRRWLLVQPEFCYHVLPYAHCHH